MKEIECPNCHTTFQVDSSTYESIVAQVRSKVFKEEIESRMAEAERQFRLREDKVKIETEREYDKRLAESAKTLSDLQNEITLLQGKLANFEATKKSDITLLESNKEKEKNDAISKKDKEIAELNNQLLNKENEFKLKLMEEKNAGNAELQKKEQELTELRAEMKSDKITAEKREMDLLQHHKQQLQDKQDEIDRLKDFKMRLSTKMVGETLEQHCFNLFSQAQSMGLYPDASFTKDNTVIDHAKGDFIFRDYIAGDEYVSVMFEMKNEVDTTATKHRNDDFLDKLDKDRTRKNCEYAVLVSMLEQGNELYDTGIVDKSHRFPKMIVIRPQFFLPVLRLITEASKKGYMERYALIKELESVREQTRDFSKFEDRLNKFRTQFGNSVIAAHKKFVAATEGIDKTIEALEKQIKALRDIKANFESSEQKLLKANEMAEEDLTVKKLTYGAPLVKKMIEEAQ